MMYVVTLVVGFVAGSITTFLFSRKNPAIVKQVDTTVKQVEAVEAKTVAVVNAATAAIEKK